METIKEGTQVKYIGKTNDYTFNKDINENSIGTVRNIFENTWQVGISLFHIHAFD